MRLAAAVMWNGLTVAFERERQRSAILSPEKLLFSVPNHSAPFVVCCQIYQIGGILEPLVHPHSSQDDQPYRARRRRQLLFDDRALSRRSALGGRRRK
jgi:hypothetical protein